MIIVIRPINRIPRMIPTGMGQISSCGRQRSVEKEEEEVEVIEKETEEEEEKEEEEEEEGGKQLKMR